MANHTSSEMPTPPDLSHRASPAEESLTQFQPDATAANGAPPSPNSTPTTADAPSQGDTVLKVDFSAEIQAKLNHAKERRTEAPHGITQVTAEILACPRCQTPYKKSDLTCIRCGMMFEDVGKTQLLERDDDRAGRRSMMGGGLFSDQKPIVFEVDGSSLTLPIAELVVIGRSSDEGENPDVGLNQFGASQRGVSRRHVAIRRKGPLVYVSDMGSTNGTFLNGRKLQRGEERILRDGDEIHLSHLMVRVRFTTPPGR